jgi:hypothetical protein
VLLVLATLQPFQGQTQKPNPVKRSSEVPTIAIADPLLAPKSVVSQFLKGIKILALPEGKQMLQDSQWEDGPIDRRDAFYVRPDYTSAESEYGALFPTDVPGVDGYKELFSMKVVTTGGAEKTEQFLVIAYCDAMTRQWKVLGSIGSPDDDSAVDVDKSISYFGLHLNEVRSPLMQKNSLEGFAYWLSMGGQLNRASSVLQSAKAISVDTSTSEALRQLAPLIDSRIDMLSHVLASIAPGLVGDKVQ